MKTILSTIFILVVSNFAFAQKNDIKNDAEKIALNSHEIERSKITKGILKKNSNNEKKEISEEKTSTAQTDIDLEIKAILDYRINRVLREDLFCLVCEAYSNKGQLA